MFKGQGPGGAGDKNRKRSEETELGWYHMMEVRAGERFNGSDGNSECLLRDYDVPGAKYLKYIILKTKCISSDSKQSYDTYTIFIPVLYIRQCWPREAKKVAQGDEAINTWPRPDSPSASASRGSRNLCLFTRGVWDTEKTCACTQTRTHSGI